ALREGIVSIGDAAVTAAALCNRVHDHRVVYAVAARVHQHGTLEPEDLLQLLEARQWRIRRRIRPVRRVRITVTRTEYVAVRIARARRRAELRLAGIGVGSLAGWNSRHAVFNENFN